MSRIVFIRHGEPLKEGEHHAGWGITETDKRLAKELAPGGEWYYLHSGLERSRQTAMAIVPGADWHVSTELNEIEKPYETHENFVQRVRRAINNLILPIAKNHDVFIVSHARFMTVAHQILKPDETVIGFDFLDKFEAEI